MLRTVCGTTTLNLVIYTGGRDNPNPVADRRHTYIDMCHDSAGSGRVKKVD